MNTLILYTKSFSSSSFFSSNFKRNYNMFVTYKKYGGPKVLCWKPAYISIALGLSDLDIRYFILSSQR